MVAVRRRYFQINFPSKFKLKYAIIISNKGFVAEQATSHYLNQWLSNLQTHIRVIPPQWVIAKENLEKHI